MKALTNILTRWMLMLLLLATSCTNDVAEVETPTQQGQYVTVRMNIPGMTATASRAAEENITSITALAFNSEGTLLGRYEAGSINNGTFTLSVHNDTKTVHFLANLPNEYDLSSITKVDDLTSLTTTVTSNLIYWGVAEYTGSNLYVDLYRNMAMIAIAPAVVDTEFNQFTQGQLSIVGLYNANTVGALVPYQEAFNFDLNGNDYYTLPESPSKGNVEYNELSASTYVFEHENTRQNPLCAICKIGESFYKVALVDDRTGEPYDIIRNHKYIIYVSDVDDYQTETYQADSYENALTKEPINLDVDEVKMVSFTYDNSVPLNLNDNETFSVTVDVPEVKDGSLTAIYIKTNDFDVRPESGLTGPNDDGVYTYIGGNTELTFTPKSAGSKSIVITGEAVNMEVPRTEISVAVNATIVAAATPENPTLYYDSEDPQTVTVNVTIPKGVTALDIDADDFTVKQGETSLELTDSVYTYSRNDATSQDTVQFVFTLSDAVEAAKTSTIIFSDVNANANVTGDTVSITVTNTPQQGEEVVLWTPEEGSTGIAFGGWKREILLTGIYSGGGSGLVEEYRDSFVDGATINIYFGPENENTPSISLGTNSGLEFKSTIANNILSYTFGASDFSEDNADENIYGHGLHIIGVNVIVTKISIIPATTP